MAKITFENGTTVNFDGNPTPQDVEEVARELGLSGVSQETSQPKQGVKGLGGFALGVGKSLGGLAVGTGSLLQRLGQGTMSLSAALPGGKTVGERFKEIRGSTGFDTLESETEAGQRVQSALERRGTAEKVGGFVGDVGTFFAPAGAITKAGQAASKAVQATKAGAIAPKTTGLATRVGTEAAGFGGVAALQEGELNKDVATTAAVSGAFPVVGAGLKKGVDALSDSLPSWLVSKIVKQTPTEKLKKGDISSFLADTGRVGNVESLIKQSDSSISNLNTNIQKELVSESKGGTGKMINIPSIYETVARELNESGAEITAKEVKDIIVKLAPQSKRLLNETETVLTRGNNLRVGLDKTLGDRGFLVDKLPFNKEVLKTFTNTLRNNIKDSAPKTRELFDEFSKELTLKKALEKASVSGGGRNNINLADILAAGVGGTVAGIPGLAAGAAARRVVESPVIKTLAARGTGKGLPKIAETLSKFSDIERAAILSFIESLESDD